MIGTLYTFGYQGMSSSVDLRRLLAETDCSTIVDVRLKVWSGNREFSMATRRTVEEAGLVYSHVPALGNLAYKTGGIEIKDISAIDPLVDRLRQGESLAFMCVCPSPKSCHRSELVAVALDLLPSLRVVHLSLHDKPKLHEVRVPEAIPMSLDEALFPLP